MCPVERLEYKREGIVTAVKERERERERERKERKERKRKDDEKVRRACHWSKRAKGRNLNLRYSWVAQSHCTLSSEILESSTI